MRQNFYETISLYLVEAIDFIAKLLFLSLKVTFTIKRRRHRNDNKIMQLLINLINVFLK